MHYFSVWIGCVILAAGARSDADDLVGVWVGVLGARGEVLVVEQDAYRLYQRTASFLVETEWGSRADSTLTPLSPGESAGDPRAMVRDAEGVRLIRPGARRGRRFVPADSDVGSPTPASQDPMVNLNAAWEAIRERYAYFDLHGAVDWSEERQRAVERVGQGEDLEDVLLGMLERLGAGDRITLQVPGVVAPVAMRATPSAGETSKRSEEEAVLRRLRGNGFTSRAEGRLLSGMLADGSLYLRFGDAAIANGASGTASRGAARGAMEAAIEEAIGGLAPGAPIVLDLRSGVADPAVCALVIAERVADEPMVAFQSQELWSPGQGFAPALAREVEPRATGRATGPVVLLTGAHTRGAAELIVLATMASPRVTRIGEPTGGAMAGSVEFRMPNGWRLCIANQRRLSWDGVSYEGVGVPPHIPAAMPAPSADEGAGLGEDRGLEAALAYLERLRAAGLVPSDVPVGGVGSASRGS